MDKAPPASSSLSQLARTLQNALQRCNDNAAGPRAGGYQSFAHLQDQLMALTDNCQAAAAAVWFEPDPVSGWTFLHFCAATDLPPQHWEWILQRCPPLHNNPCISSHTTALGETVVDVFFQHRLGNLKWQSTTSKLHTKRFVAILASCDRTVISALPSCTSAESLLILQEGVVAAPLLDNDRDAPEILMLRDQVHIARTFLRDLYLLLQKIRVPEEQEEPFDWMTALARIGPSVPSIVADWMELYLEQQHFADDETILERHSADKQASNKQRALHVLCQTKPLAHLPRQALSLLRMCLTKQGANSIIPETGRLPIEEALQSGWSFESVYDLWKMTTNPVTKALPLFAYTALHTIDERAVEILARYKRSAFSVYCWHMSSDSIRQGFMEASRHDYELVHMSSIFECLRASPTSLGRRQAKHGKS